MSSLSNVVFDELSLYCLILIYSAIREDGKEPMIPSRNLFMLCCSSSSVVYTTGLDEGHYYSIEYSYPWSIRNKY